jgi:hypothetical protein
VLEQEIFERSQKTLKVMLRQASNHHILAGRDRGVLARLSTQDRGLTKIGDLLGRVEGLDALAWGEEKSKLK